MTVNKVILIGNLGQDPELRQTQSGTAVCNMRIATSERRRDRDGNWNDHTEWHTVVCFGRTAENVHRYMQKGRQIFIEGRLQTRKWQDRNGQDRWSTEVVADNVRFLQGGTGGRRDQRPDDSTSGPSRTSGGAAPNGGGSEEPPPFDDDVPF